LFSEPSDIQKWRFGIKVKFIFYLFSNLRRKKIAFLQKKKKKISLFLFHPPLHHLHCKYGAPKQAKHEQINVFRPVSEQNCPFCYRGLARDVINDFTDCRRHIGGIFIAPHGTF
jgi:hypothetical protein